MVTGTTTTTTRYYYDDQRIVLQTRVSGQTETDDRYFAYGNYIDEVLLMHTLAGTNTGDYYYGHDHLYSPAVLFNAAGTPVERYEYDVYGKTRIIGPGLDGSYFTSDDESRTVSAYGNPYTFTGRELDSLDSGNCTLYYYRARTYDPATGRFLQRDKIRYVDGMNLYQYVISNPLENTDPLGLITITEGDEDGSVSITYEEPASNITIDVFTFVGPWSDYKYFGRAPMIWVIGLKRSWQHGRCIYETVEGVAMQEARLKTRPYSLTTIYIYLNSIPEIDNLNLLFEVVGQFPGPVGKVGDAGSVLIGQILNVKVTGWSIIRGGKGLMQKADIRVYDTGKRQSTITTTSDVEGPSCCPTEWLSGPNPPPFELYDWKPYFENNLPKR